MGSGKSTIGRILSHKLNRILLDTDSVIASNYGMEIAQIFSEYGEEKFREIENRVAKWISLSVKDAIIATGGGMPMFYDVSNLGIVVYLKTPFDVLEQRIYNDKTRPLSLNNLYELYCKRELKYEEKADLLISMSGNITLDVGNICDKLKQI